MTELDVEPPDPNETALLLVVFQSAIELVVIETPVATPVSSTIGAMFVVHEKQLTTISAGPNELVASIENA